MFIISLLILSIVYVIYLIVMKKETFALRFIHIPKNAGTSIENAASKQNIHWGFKEWTKDEDKNNKKNIFKNKNPWKNIHNNKTYKTKKCFPWHVNYADLGDNFLDKDDTTFCVVRNPYTKIVSAYKYAHGKNSSKEGLNKFIKSKLGKFEKNEYWNGCHIMPQYKYTHEGVKCENILSFENLDNEFEELLKNNDLPNIKLPKNNKSVNKLSEKDLNRESIDLINKVYHKDFEYFNYSKL